MEKIECVIMDWAGTAVDDGCFAPVAAFVESFKAIGAPVTAAETRAHMGLTKIEEIRELFAIEHVSADFHAKYAWSVGVILGSNELALTEEEVSAMSTTELRERMKAVRYKMYAAGADYVMDDITELPLLIESMKRREK